MEAMFIDGEGGERRRGVEDRGLCASVALKKCRGRQNKKRTGKKVVVEREVLIGTLTR
jgi:hypothetical protein